MSRILYKYLDIVGAKYMIENQNLQFTNASQLNDPFDCHPKLIDYSNVPDTKLQGWIPKEWWIDATIHGYAVCQKLIIHYSCGVIIAIITKVFV